MKVLPAGMSFERALISGYLGRIEHRAYLDWIKTLPCDDCGAAPPSDPSHSNTHKGMGTKSPDWWAIPQCRECHDAYECEPSRFERERHLRRAALYLLRAIVEGKLVWK